MFAVLRLRSEIVLAETCSAFHDYCCNYFLAGTTALEIMAERALTTPDLQNYHSTASAPSLRGREQTEIMDRPRSSDGDANVKVVVRVRKFIKRGIAHFHLVSV